LRLLRRAVRLVIRFDPKRWGTTVASNGKATPTWNDVKAKLTGFDRTGLLGLVKDLYAANRENQAFLHARLGLGYDPLKPYKSIISR
jgi:hypothetical protein